MFGVPGFFDTRWQQAWFGETKHGKSRFRPLMLEDPAISSNMTCNQEEPFYLHYKPLE